jgi:hypothetical protein
VSSVAVPPFEDRSGFGRAEVRDSLTLLVIQKLVRDNSLNVVSLSDADAALDAAITAITDAPTAVGTVQNQPDRATKRRLTIAVHVTFKNLRTRHPIWEKDFSEWGEYDAQGGLSQRDIGVRKAMDLLSDDILLETVAGW